MPMPTPTEIRLDEYGDETHESWLLMRFNHVSGSTRLFDSEVVHQHYVQLTITRCTRKRDLHHDWLHSTKTILEADMSLAQFGALVSSFGDGSGVPATLDWLQGVGQVPRPATHDSRLDKSHKEVRGAASKAMEDVNAAHAAVQEGFEQKLGVKEMRARLRNLQIVMGNLPGNLEFAAKSLTEHSEKVSTKLRADLEAMVINAQRRDVELKSISLLEIQS